MKLPFAIGTVGLSSVLGLAYYASASGAMAPKPSKSPMSVREYSNRYGNGLTGGRTHFVGGGIHRGK